jgi:phage FluMu protein Com
MVRVHNGKLGNGNYAKDGEKKITAENHNYSMVYKTTVKVSHANVTCPLCKFMNKIMVKEEPAITFKCNCGQMLKFDVPKG